MHCFQGAHKKQLLEVEVVQNKRNFSIPLERKHHSEMWKKKPTCNPDFCTVVSSKANDPTPPFLFFFLASIFPRSITSGNAWHNGLSPQTPHRETIAHTLNSSAHTRRCLINRDQAPSDAGSMFPEDPAVSSSSPKEQNLAVQFRTEILRAVSRAN